jgi:hypothetical protein
MILLGVDPLNGVIVSAARLEGLAGVGMALQGPSHLSDTDTVAVQFDTAKFEAMLASRSLTLSQFFAGPDRFVLVNDVLKVRPSIDVLILSEHTVQQDGTPVVALGMDVKLCASYTDDDNVGFLDAGLAIKIKDRNNFINLASFYEQAFLSTDVREFRFTLRSAFPGIAHIRAKDASYKCLSQSLKIRFKQE